MAFIISDCSLPLYMDPLQACTAAVRKKRRGDFVRINTYKFKYLLKGKIAYKIGDELFIMEEGDSLFF